MDAQTFILTASRGDEAQARSALEQNARLAAARTETGISVIAAVVYTGRLPLAREIAQHRDDLDLFEAACVGDLERVEAVLSTHPESLDHHSPDGFTPIGLAAYFGHIELLKKLLEKGADLETPAANPMRVCPIHSAAAHPQRGRATTIAKHLLDAGADPNAQQEGGFTALHEAVLNEDLELAELLLSYGANPHVSNDEGDSPVQLAQSKGQTEMVQLLERDLVRHA